MKLPSGKEVKLKTPTIEELKKFSLSDVSQRSELLSDFEKWINKKCNKSYYDLPAGYVLDIYKKSLNCD